MARHGPRVNPENGAGDCQKGEEGTSGTQHLHPTLSSPAADMQLLLFLQSCYGDTEATKECMTQYFTCILEVPQFFDHWDVTRDHIKQGLDTV